MCTASPSRSTLRSRRCGLRTDAARRFKKVANATVVVWKMLLVAERKFRHVDSAELLPVVAAGHQYHDGVPVSGGQRHDADACLHTVAGTSSGFRRWRTI